MRLVHQPSLSRRDPGATVGRPTFALQTGHWETGARTLSIDDPVLHRLVYGCLEGSVIDILLISIPTVLALVFNTDVVLLENVALTFEALDAKVKGLLAAPAKPTK